MEHNYHDFDYTGGSGEAFDSKEIGKRIRLARKMRHISQTKLAEMLDRSLRTIQKYECGDIDVSISALVSICAALDVPLSYMIGLGTRRAVLTSLADVMDFLFLLDTADELDFDIEVEKPPKSQSWKCSLSFGGIFLGCRNRQAPAGAQCECLPLPPELYARLEAAYHNLEAIGHGG